MQNISTNYHHKSHHNKSTSSKKAIYYTLILTLIFALLEFFGGLFSNSLSLLGDSFHMFSDVIALFSSLIAIIFASKLPTKKFTFGFLRLETIVAFLNGLTLVILAGYILVEGIIRLIFPRQIESNSMFIISVIGFIFNIIITAILINSNKHENNLNIKSAIWHFIGDTLNSVGVILASIIIHYTNFIYIDAILSIFISIIIFLGGFKITKESFFILMEAVPNSYNSDEIRNDILKIENILSIHEFHIWCTNENEVSLIAHIILKDDKDNKNYFVLNDINNMLKEKYNIEHISIQIEDPNINKHFEKHI